MDAKGRDGVLGSFSNMSSKQAQASSGPTDDDAAPSRIALVARSAGEGDLSGATDAAVRDAPPAKPIVTPAAAAAAPALGREGRDGPPRPTSSIAPPRLSAVVPYTMAGHGPVEQAGPRDAMPARPEAAPGAVAPMPSIPPVPVPPAGRGAAPAGGVGPPGTPATHRPLIAPDPPRPRDAATDPLPPIPQSDLPQPAAALAAAEAPSSLDAPRGAAARPEAPPPFAQAVIDRLRHLAAKAENGSAVEAATGLRTELELYPEELGRLRMVLQAGERGLHLQVLADRPETLDLMRRHAELLQRSMASDGVTLAELTFGGRGQTSQDGRAPIPTRPAYGSGAATSPPLPDPAGAMPPLAHVGPLDLRL